jgi:hypothetical protein
VLSSCATRCRSVTGCVNLSLARQLHLLPGMEGILIYGTLKCNHDRTVYRDQRSMGNMKVRVVRQVWRLLLPSGSSPYTSTDETNKKNIHITHITKSTVKTIQNSINTSTHTSINDTPTHYKTI